MAIIFYIVMTVLICVIGYLYLDAKRKLKKYAPLIDLDKTINEKTKLIEKISFRLAEIQKKFDTDSSDLKKQFDSLTEQKKAERDKLTHDLKLLSDEHDLISAGFYKSKYAFNDSKKFEDQMVLIKDRQRNMIKDNSAIICRTEWVVGDSRAEGKKMIDRIIKLGLSAFNVQCDNEILKVKFGNIGKAEEKIYKIFEVVNKLLEANHCNISSHFLKLKLEELQLAYEYQEQLFKEKAEQKELREQMREEEKARKEIERNQKEAEKEEKRYLEALEKARAELDKKSESEKFSFLTKIADLEFKLKEAQENKERAIAQAELTRSGHVYVISNLGSFGENVYKIGMTRRLDPQERIDELGDASVPFEFDVHAMIKSEDAPALEKKLHDTFTGKRINKVNLRKEFFKVTLEEIEKEVKNFHKSEFKLTLVAEAKQWRQSEAVFNEGSKRVA